MIFECIPLGDTALREAVDYILSFGLDLIILLEPFQVPVTISFYCHLVYYGHFVSYHVLLQSPITDCLERHRVSPVIIAKNVLSPVKEVGVEKQSFQLPVLD